MPWLGNELPSCMRWWCIRVAGKKHSMNGSMPNIIPCSSSLARIGIGQWNTIMWSTLLNPTIFSKLHWGTKNLRPSNGRLKPADTLLYLHMDAICHRMIMIVLVLGCLRPGLLLASPPTEGPSLGAAHQAFQQGDFHKTLTLVEPILQVEPTHEEARLLKMFSLARLGRTADALDEYGRIVEFLGKPDDDSLLRELAIQSILPFRNDMREQIRGAAYTALKEVGSEDVVPYLEDGLSDGTGIIRALAAEGLSQLPAGIHSSRFQSALHDPAALVRVTVLKGLAKSGDSSFIPLIQPLVHDKQPIVQVAAAAALYRLGRTDYWSRIEQAVYVTESYERGMALQVLGELGDARAIPLLERGLHDPQPSIRAASASSLGKLAVRDTVQILLPVLNEPVPAVRSVAALSLGKLHAEEAVPALTRALRDRNPGVRAAAIAALLQMNSPYSLVAPALQELMFNENPGLRSSAAKALAHGRAQDVVPVLKLMLNDPVPRSRISALRSLGRVGGRAAIPLFKRMLRDQDEAVRATAAGALAHVLSHSRVSS
ncbi:MAG: hypothetical protein D6704_01040 [Nitrospirae bacterium]|nr:MAG: hypothetical protein D6704_01040 [Nitrospirota bacterium]